LINTVNTEREAKHLNSTASTTSLTQLHTGGRIEDILTSGFEGNDRLTEKIWWGCSVATKACKLFRSGVPNLWYAYHWWCSKVFQVERK